MKRRARAIASCNVLPVWNAHQTNTAEKDTTSIHPVMKQYAASGSVERFESTSVMRKSRSVPRHSIELAIDGEDEDTGAGRAASAAFAVAAWDNGGAEDMLREGRLDGGCWECALPRPGLKMRNEPSPMVDHGE